MIEEKLIDATDSSADVLATARLGGAEVAFFEFDITAHNASGTVRFVLQAYNQLLDDWTNYWMDATQAGVANRKLFFVKNDTTNMSAILAASRDDSEVMPLPGRWRVKIDHNAGAEASYTVHHWRY